MTEAWDIEEHKIWAGISKDEPRWASLQFACQSYDAAEDLMRYMSRNKPRAILRVVRKPTTPHPSKQ